MAFVQQHIEVDQKNPRANPPNGRSNLWSTLFVRHAVRAVPSLCAHTMPGIWTSVHHIQCPTLYIGRGPWPHEPFMCDGSNIALIHAHMPDSFLTHFHG